MFTDSLLDSPWDNRYGRGWSMIASFAVQAAMVGSLLVLPLIYSSGLPFPCDELAWTPRARHRGCSSVSPSHHRTGGWDDRPGCS
jgi:hypothetical protein